MNNQWPNIAVTVPNRALGIPLPQWLCLNYRTCSNQCDITEGGTSKSLKSACMLDLLSFASENTSATMSTSPNCPSHFSYPKIWHTWIRPPGWSCHSQASPSQKNCQPNHRMVKKRINIRCLKLVGLSMFCYTAKANCENITME